MDREQRGFTLLEVIIAIALTVGVILAVAGAVANSLHGAALAEKKMQMRDDALSALADLRAVTAYDPLALGSLSYGKTATMTIKHSATDIETIGIQITSDTNTTPLGAPASNTVAEATVTELGLTVTERQTLYDEAPAPGSAVNQ